jgi:hypothetical protein
LDWKLLTQHPDYRDDRRCHDQAGAAQSDADRPGREGTDHDDDRTAYTNYECRDGFPGPPPHVETLAYQTYSVTSLSLLIAGRQSHDRAIDLDSNPAPTLC